MALASRALLALMIATGTAHAQGWQRMTPARSPPAREGAQMVFDTSRGRVLLFGGGIITEAFGDTWEWDGVTWTELSDAGPARLDHGMAWDPVRRRAVVFGGTKEVGVPLGDTWEWDGAAWTLVDAAGAPPRMFHGMAWSEEHQLSLVFGGQSGLAGTPNVELWGWDGASWRMVNDAGPGGAEGRRRLVSLVADPFHHRLLLFGGVDVITAPATYFADTWQLDRSGWRELSDAGPSARSTAAMGCSPATGEALLFGGATSPTTRAGDTWAFDGDRWRWLGDAGPTARRGRGVAVDPVRGVLVIFGGFDGTTLLADTWELHFPDAGPGEARAYRVGCGCGTGAELAVALALLLPLSGRRRRTSSGC